LQKNNFSKEYECSKKILIDRRLPELLQAKEKGTVKKNVRVVDRQVTVIR
jgi:hypothetical protein